MCAVAEFCLAAKYYNANWFGSDCTLSLWLDGCCAGTVAAKCAAHHLPVLGWLAQVCGMLCACNAVFAFYLLVRERCRAA